MLGKTLLEYDVTTEETSSVSLEVSKVDICSTVVVTEARLDDDTDSELCLVSEGLEFPNVLCIV